jgi:hypothetical protein
MSQLRRRKHDLISNNARIVGIFQRTVAETTATTKRILNLCDLGDHFDEGENDNYWISDEQDNVSVSDALKKLKACDQIETVDLRLDLEWYSCYLKLQLENIESLPVDYNAPFDKNSTKIASTKRAFCIDLHNVMSQTGVKFSQINRIFEVFQRHQTSLNLPTLTRNPLLSIKKDISVKNNIKSYVGKDTGTIAIDVCKNDCIAFHGVQNIKGRMIDCSKEIICPVCSCHRYSHCTNPLCSDLDYSKCNPFVFCEEVNSRHKDGFGHQDRTPEKILFYRPITSKLLHLYKLSLLDGNEALLGYFLEKNRVTRPGI